MVWLYSASDLLKFSLSIRDSQLLQSGFDFESLYFPAEEALEDVSMKGSSLLTFSHQV